MRTDRRDLRRRITAIAATQSGYFTAAQALKVGYSYQAQKFHADHGNWLRVDRGVFRLPEWPIGNHDDLVRWSLWSRDRAVVSHETALALHDLSSTNPAVVHLTVPPNFRSRASSVRLHRGELPDQDVLRHEGFRVTTPIRSLLDVAAVGSLDLDELTHAVRDACERVPAAKRELLERGESFGPRTALNVERALRLAGQL